MKNLKIKKVSSNIICAHRDLNSYLKIVFLMI